MDDALKSVSLDGSGQELSKEPEPEERPNIIFILADDLGYGDLSSYGAKDLHTPNLDSLVASGIRFDNFYANCPVCSPTRASILTGQYPDMVGVPGVIRTHPYANFGYLASHAVMLPEVLKRAGYDTAIIGKWHLGLESPNTPNERGFDHFHGFLGDMMDDYYSHRRHDINYMRLNDKEIDPEGHATGLFTEWSLDYIKSRGKFKQPFFLYLAYNAPHTPIQPPEEWLDRVREREQGIDENRAKLVALIEHFDDGIGKVLKALSESGLTDNTLIIFTSDNGGQLNVGASNGALRGGKGEMWEGGIREPMFAVWPGRVKPGSCSSSVVLTMDLFPTMCEAAGADFSHEIDGRSILPTVFGEPTTEEDERFLFWVRREGGPHYGGQSFYAVRYGNWKLLQNIPFEPLKLYNLQNDPQEENPLDDKQEEYRMLFNALQNHIIRTGAVPWQKFPA
ncbi:N-acetylgalactosamine 6-sulfate sulfatase [Candidatus Poribacteria bacterium]|nr:N-acetylgalactosamine 6-sulfate sulfatase [Candidatus Poribacteria bacterium]